MRFPWFLPIIYLLFASLSLVTLQSIEPKLVQNQLIFFVVGGVMLLVISRIPLHLWKISLPFFYIFSILLLLFTLFLGNLTRGTVSWIPIGPFHIQPSQIAVPITLFLQSLWLYHSKRITVQTILGFITLGVIPFSLIFLEPDLGTGMVFFLSSFTVFAMSPVQKKYVIGGIGAIFIAGMLSWNFLLKPYQKERITSFLSTEDLQGAGYNSYQSLIAVGSGQWWGRGLGHGVQSQLRFLPEHQTDFIFASIAEETGFVGSSFVLMLYLILFYYIARSISQVKTTFAHYTLLGCSFLLFYQMLINVGMNMGLLPITGITLPLLSYGGSSILSFSLVFGIMIRILYEEREWKSMRIR